MAAGGGSKTAHTFPSELSAFKNLFAACNKHRVSASQQKFVKKLDAIPTVALLMEESCHAALNLAEPGLIGQFNGL